MKTEQAKTYLLYSRGLMPNDLTVGSLHLDPANPTDSDRKAFPYKETVEARLLRPPQIDEPCSLSAHASSRWLAGAGVLGLVKTEFSDAGAADVTVSGTIGRRLQLANSEQFLNEVILKSDTARAWLAAKISILNSMRLIAKMERIVSKSPRIWMVTGVQYIKDGNVTHISGKDRSTSLQASVPVPDPTIIATTAGVPAIDVVGSLETKSSQNASYGYKDERVWAAQFRCLNVKLRSKSDVKVAEDETGWIRLEDAQDLGRFGIRGTNICDRGDEAGPLLAQIALEIDGHGETSITAAQPCSIDEMLEIDWPFLEDVMELDG